MAGRGAGRWLPYDDGSQVRQHIVLTLGGKAGVPGHRTVDLDLQPAQRSLGCLARGFRDLDVAEWAAAPPFPRDDEDLERESEDAAEHDAAEDEALSPLAAAAAATLRRAAACVGPRAMLEATFEALDAGLAAPERTDMQARPNACDRRDVHFRMPGFPDLEVQAWFSLIATGLRDVVYDSAKGGAVAGCWHQPPRQKSAPWRRCQDA